METTYKRRWYLVYKDEDSSELNKHFTTWFDSKSQDHHFEQVVRCYPSIETPCICAEHYGNIDCVPMLSTVFFITSIDTTAVNRSWIDTYSLMVKDTPTEITPDEFNHLMIHSQGFPIAKYNLIIPSETEQGIDMVLMSFYKGVLGGLCVIEKEYADEASLQASRGGRHPWEGLFREASDPSMLDDTSLARCAIERDIEGNGYIRPMTSSELAEAKMLKSSLYDEFLIN